MKEQFDAVYNYLTRNQYPDGLTKDENIDCGLFSIAFAYHAAAGDDVKRLNFGQDKMRGHLVSCLSDQKLTPLLLQTAD